MSEKAKQKAYTKPTFLDEARTIGFMEGYVTGRNKILEELIEFNLLKKEWKKIYNKSSNGQYYIK